MTNAKTIATGIRDTLRDIPALVAELGSEERIVAYYETEFDDQDRFKVIAQMEPGLVLVMYNESWFGKTGPWSRSFSILYRSVPGSTPADLEFLIVNGVPEGNSKYGGRPFILQDFVSTILSPQEGRIGWRSVFLGEDSRLTYWEFNLIVLEASIT